MKTLLFSLLLLLSGGALFGQTANFRFRQQLSKAPTEKMAFAVTNTKELLPQLLSDGEISVKAVTPQWIFIQASPLWIDRASKTGLIEQFHYELSLPTALNDTSRVTHFVNEVHQGLGGLPQAYTGEGVIIGYVDQGLDYHHPDFIDENGVTRVLWYWDHSLPFNALHTPMPYGYGQAWTQQEIIDGTCTSNEESTAHGTSVAGAGSGDGSANGTNKGMAPNTKIIVVESNFDLPNWTLTVADACDFIFKKADELGMPAIVNLSLGTYLGSHDGDDPASVLMEQLVDEHPGRMIVCAAGNSGAIGKYHVHGENSCDTSFVWFQNSPSSQLGPNTIYFDLWSDLDESDWSYALAANKPSGNYEERAQTIYRAATTSAGTPILDTLYNGTNRIATLELYPEIVGNTFHLEVFFSGVDSTAYNYAFKTTGGGSYDLWSGAGLGLNNILSNVPSPGVYPPIQYYNFPDTLQSIVSAWNCSEKMISVGNIRNRFGHIDGNGNYYQPAPGYNAVQGQLSPNSSKGPNRRGVTKPDVVACGDVCLAPGPMWILTNPAFYASTDSSHWHVRNGGTSMASPIVAGIGALYFEAHPNATYQQFKSDMLQSTTQDAFTGSSPNNGYGYGKINALNLLLNAGTSYNYQPVNSCGPVTINGQTYTASGQYYQTLTNTQGNDSLVVVQLKIEPLDNSVTATNGQLTAAESCVSYQWINCLTNTPIPGATSQTYDVLIDGQYAVILDNGVCVDTSACIEGTVVGITENDPLAALSVYPNPSNGLVTIVAPEAIEAVRVFSMAGSLVKNAFLSGNTLDLSRCHSGSYLVEFTTGSGTVWRKIVRN